MTNILFFRRHGAQNAYDAASKATLENEFGTSNEDECMTKILETGDLQHTEVNQDGWWLCGTRQWELTCTIRQESVRDQKMTAWELVRLTEGLRMRQWWDKLAASSEARLQHQDVMIKPVALRQRIVYALMNCKDVPCP